MMREKELEWGQWTSALSEIGGLKIMATHFPDLQEKPFISSCSTGLNRPLCQTKHHRLVPRLQVAFEYLEQVWASTSTQSLLHWVNRPKMLNYDNLQGCWVFASWMSICHTAIFENHWWSTVPSKSSWKMHWWNLRRTPIVLRDCLLVPLLKKFQTSYMCWYCWRNQSKGKKGRKESFKDTRSIVFIAEITWTRPH